MAALSNFLEDVEEELNPLIQKAVPDKTKIPRKYGVKNLKDSEISTKSIRILALNFYHQSIVWLGLRPRHSIGDSRHSTGDSRHSTGDSRHSTGDRNFELVFLLLIRF